MAQTERDVTADTTKNEDEKYDPSKLSFLGVHPVRLTTGMPDPDTLYALGEFSVEGPDVDSLRPITVGAVAPGKGDQLFFHGWHGAGRMDPATGSWTRFDKESIGRQPHGGRTTAMAFDTRRNRLLLSSDKYLYAYDPEAKRWLWRKDIKSALLGLAYDPDRDVFYGVLGENLDAKEMFLRERMLRHPEAGGGKVVLNAPLKIRHFTPEGESHVEVTVHKPLPPKPIPYNFQTTFSQGLLVLFTDHSLFAINPLTGEVVHRGETTLVRDGKPWEPENTAPLSLDERCDRIRQRIAALKDQLGAKQSAELTERLDYVFRCMEGDFSKAPKSLSPEIHSVGMYTIHDPTMKGELTCPVTISHTAAPVILILSAHHTITWNVKAAAGAHIEQVVLAGWEQQKVEKLPESTPVIDRTGEEQPKHYLYVAPTGRTAGARDGFRGTVHAIFGFEPMTMQFEYNGPSYEIGPGSDTWRKSYLEGLVRNLERDVLIAENDDLSFTALYRRGKENEEKTAESDFSLKGPANAPTQWLTEPVHLITSGRKGDERFVVDRKNEIHTLRNGELTPLGSPEKEMPGRTTAIVHDSKRGRIIAWHSREHRGNGLSINGRVVIEYDLQKGQWKQIGSIGADIGSVAWDAKRDVFFGLVLPLRSGVIQDLVVMNHRGAILESVPLSQPFYWDLDAGPPQAVFARGHLIVVNSPQAVLLPDGQERLVSQVIAIDPTTGQTYFTGRYFCD